MKTQQFHIRGMTCQACATRLEKVLNKQAFIQKAEVSFASETAQIVYHDDKFSPENVISAIEKAGFHADLPSPECFRQPEESVRDYRMWALLAFSAPFAFGMLGMLFGSYALMPPLWLQILLASVMQTYFALPFYKGAYASVRNGTANMDVLITIGTLSIYLYSLVMVAIHGAHAQHDIYFEAAVMVLAFVSLGKHWEAKTKRTSLNALNALLRLTPREVSVLRDGQWHKIALTEVQKGDVLRAADGERIAADGETLEGEAWADESHLTGESRPIKKSVGDTVLAGAIISSGSLKYRVHALGADTLLGDMMSALAQAQSSKAPLARLADKVAAVFVPAVLIIAALTFIGNALYTGDITIAIMRAAAVLVVACPCALGLATPAAVMAGMGVAVRHGVWFKNAETLEAAGQINRIALDKTGTITQGKPAITAIRTDVGINETQLLALAAALEQHVAHPLAQAVIRTAQQRDIEIPEVQQVYSETGAGVRAILPEWGEISVGKPEFCGVMLPEEWTSEGVWRLGSVVAVAAKGQLLGAFALADSLKENSADAVQHLRDLGIDVFILSGDQNDAVRHIAKQLKLSEDHALGVQSPRDKARCVQAWQNAGWRVAMVGDGVNDAPALAAAHVGFAVRGHTDIAEHSADAVLVRASLDSLANGVKVARLTVRTIWQNLFFAFVYNALCIPLAALGYLTPVLAGAMMALSSVSVLLNALRLKRVRITLPENGQ